MFPEFTRSLPAVTEKVFKMFCNITYFRGQGLSDPFPDDRGADIHVQRCDAETELQLHCH